AGAGGVDTLADDAARDRGVFIEPFAEALVDDLFDVALDVAVEFALGLAFKLRLRQANTDYRFEAFANGIAGDADFVFLLLEHAVGGGKVVDGARERGAEARKVSAAVDGVDGVGEGENVFAVAVVVLQRDFDFDVAALALHVNRRIVQRFLAAVEMLDEFGDAAGEAELGALFGAFVGERDLQAFVEESIFGEARGERVVAENGFFEDRGVGMKSDFGSGFACFSGLLQLRSGLAFFVGLFPDRAVPLNFEFEPVGKRIDYGNADAVQAARNFVSVAVEFSAGVEDGQNNFRGGALFRGVDIHGDATAIVSNSDGVVFVNGDVDFVGVAGHRFV